MKKSRNFERRANTEEPEIALGCLSVVKQPIGMFIQCSNYIIIC